MTVIGAAVDDRAHSADDAEALPLNEAEEPVSMPEIAWRLRYIFGLAWLTTLQYGSVGPSTLYISTSFFAGEDADCNAEPDSAPCKKGAAELAFWRGMFGGVSQSFAWLLALTLGSMSDAIGRRPLFRAKTVVSVVPIVALALHVYVGLTLWVYLAVGILYEAFDINGVFLAFMSDVVTEPQERATAYAVLIIGIVLGAGPVLPVAGVLSAGAAVGVALTAASVKLLYVFTIFPESALRGSEPTSAHSFGLLSMAREAIAVFGRNSFIFRMALVLVLSGLSLAGLATVSTPIVTGYLGMPKKQSTGLMVATGVSALAGMAFLRPLTHRCGEIRALQACLAVAVLYPLLFALCTEPWHVVALCMLLTGPLILQFPILSAIKSNLVAADEQGLVQGALAAIRVAAVAVADVFFGWFFRAATKNGSAPRSSTIWPLLAVSGLAAAAFLIACTLPSKPPPPAWQRPSSSAVGGATATELPPLD